ncbi:MAG: glycoside hydrolase family 130 protein [Bacteroidetes bacterium]|nr:glycoside hydrolase family 130 protein [Bacteroidota bacterium]
MVNRFIENPIITTQDIDASQAGFVVECVMNPSAFSFEGKTWLLLRVAERPIQKLGIISFPIMNENGGFKIIEFDKNDPKVDLSDARIIKHGNTNYLSTISHLRLVCSDDGVHFHEPKDHQPTRIFGEGKLETFGIEDCRIALINGVYHLTYTQVSENGVGVGLIRTSDWKNFSREGMILPPHNKDCALFEEKIDGNYYCLHRPSGVDIGGNFIWLATSENLTHWGNHQCIARTRKGMWDSERVGAGATPIKTKEGWLAIYHGADENSRYCLGAILLDLKDPSKVIARSVKPILEPTADYEKKGFFNNVVFTNGHVVNGDNIVLYYGASDQVICGADLSIEGVLDRLKEEVY